MYLFPAFVAAPLDYSGPNAVSELTQGYINVQLFLFADYSALALICSSSFTTAPLSLWRCSIPSKMPSAILAT